MPRRLSSTIWSHSATGAFRACPSSMTPALLTTMSSRPSSPTVRSTAAAASCSAVTSAGSTRAIPPSPRIVPARSSSRSRRRASSATAAPSAASLRAIAAPIPLLEPVISATAFCSGLVMAARLLVLFLFVGEELRVVARRPRLAQAGSGQLPVRADLPGHLAQVAAQVLDRGPAPEPVAVVHAVDDQARLEHQRVRDHRVVVRVGVLLDVEVLLHMPAGIGQERPLRADRVTELVGLEVVVCRDRDDLRVGHRDLRVERRQLQVLLVVLGAEPAA